MTERLSFTQAPAVVVGTCGHGLALIRALHCGDVPVVALESNTDLPGLRTRCARVEIVPTIHGAGLIDALMDLRRRIDSPATPVLFLTNDSMVRTLGSLWPALEGHYLLSWSHCRDALTPLLEKPALEARCQETGVNYPATFVLQSAADAVCAADAIGFPMIAKPARPLSGFKTALPDSVESLAALAQRFANDLPFLVQRFIPGDDTRIFFSALYLDRGRELARFDGHKLRSRPMGHTSIAEACPDDAVHAQARRFFEGLALSGPLSLELKRDTDGSLWVIEPTVGRTDFWVGLCIENGVNLPLVEYCHQAGQPLPRLKQVDTAVWFNEDRDPFGRLWLGAPQRRGMHGRRSAFVFLQRSDAAPAKAFLAKSLRHYSGAVGRRLRRVPPAVSNSTSASAATAATVAGSDPAPPICRQWDSFDALRQAIDWEGLNENARTLFTAPDWFATLAATCPAPGAEPLLLEATDNQGCTVLALRSHGRGRVESLSNYYAAQFDPVSTDESAAVRHAPLFADWLARHRIGTLKLHPLSPETPFWRAFTVALKQRGFSVDSYFTFGNWYHPCEGDSWAHYLATRPSRLRHTISRSRRKAASMPNVRMSVLDARATAEEIASAVQDFKVVYANSWKKPEPYSSFIGRLCEFAHRRGWLRIGLCHIDGEPVAAQIWFVKAGVASIFKLAYDERHASRGVGTLVSAALSEHVLDVDRVKEIDFLAGDDPYKSEWMARRRERHGIVAFNPLTAAGLAAATLHYGARLMRRPSRRDGWEGRPATPGDRSRPRPAG